MCLLKAPKGAGLSHVCGDSPLPVHSLQKNQVSFPFPDSFHWPFLLYNNALPLHSFPAIKFSIACFVPIFFSFTIWIYSWLNQTRKLKFCSRYQIHIQILYPYYSLYCLQRHSHIPWKNFEQSIIEIHPTFSSTTTISHYVSLKVLFLQVGVHCDDYVAKWQLIYWSYLSVTFLIPTSQCCSRNVKSGSTNQTKELLELESCVCSPDFRHTKYSGSKPDVCETVTM